MPTQNPIIQITAGSNMRGFISSLGLTGQSTSVQSKFVQIDGFSDVSSVFRIQEFAYAVGSLAASATVDLDLFGGTLTNFFAQSVVFTNLKYAAIFLTGSDYDTTVLGQVGALRVGNASSNPHPLWFGAATHTQSVLPNGLPLQQGSGAGIAVNSTTRNVRIENTSLVTAYYAAFFAGMTS